MPEIPDRMGEDQKRGEERSCLSRFVAVLGFPQPTIVPCVLAAGHEGHHRYEAEWGDSAAEEASADPYDPVGPTGEVYLAAALAQQKTWRPIVAREDPELTLLIAARMAEEPPFRVAVESAYRAGREDAARDLEAEADDEAQRPGRAEPSELIERWLREAAEIARGEDQDTREGRT